MKPGTKPVSPPPAARAPGGPAASRPLWIAGAASAALLVAALALWWRSGVEIYLTILFNSLALCF